jgi:hypothetical protein
MKKSNSLLLAVAALFAVAVISVEAGPFTRSAVRSNYRDDSRYDRDDRGNAGAVIAGAALTAAAIGGAARRSDRRYDRRNNNGNRGGRRRR